MVNNSDVFAVDEMLRTEADALLHERGLKPLLEEYSPILLRGNNDVGDIILQTGSGF